VLNSSPSPHKVFLLADTKMNRRSCSAVGLLLLTIAAPVITGKLVIQRTPLRVKMNSHSTGFNVDRKGTLVRTLDALRRNTMKNGHYYFLASPLSVELID
jgi:type IV secretory pathway protease TraF